MLNKVSGSYMAYLCRNNYVAICSKLIKANLSKSVSWLITYDFI